MTQRPRAGGKRESDRSDGSDRSVRSSGSGDPADAPLPSGHMPHSAQRRLSRVALLSRRNRRLRRHGLLLCRASFNPRSRNHDQMVQAARSGRQNIAEGSRASATSSHTELRLVNVARSSLDELLLDYEDYLRHNGHKQWKKDSAEALAVRKVGWQSEEEKDRSDRTDPSDQAELSVPYRGWLDHKDPAIVANAVICLIHQANYLLDRQMQALEGQFIADGGYSEQQAAARLQRRAQDRTNPSDPSDPLPACPLCGAAMALRTAKKGPRAGSQFVGCTKYPACKGTRRL